MTLPIQGYSCALMSDILLQGHLYVTENYIAFHSNVFGYVTRVIIVTALKKITPTELFSKCFPSFRFTYQRSSSSQYDDHQKSTHQSQHQFLIPDPDPDDLDHSFHKRENCENHSKRGRGLDHRGHSHLHIFHIQRGNL